TWVASAPDLDVDAQALVHALKVRSGSTVLVSEEVGLAVHPATAVGRAFVDALGHLNQTVAAMAERVLLVVAGRTLEL
ncbi:MAG: bifunctional adenosylcobinamide kinase/adenosylcobinamide-phosphate guanylyltransferase, partial [Actinomycetota bacterium]|nr:bifunctional adenosylcobinamide kinase/adenosylcobinamide-phosphate guanylyltransferase [Actinomycetota bacterium]